MWEPRRFPRTGMDVCEKGGRARIFLLAGGVASIIGGACGVLWLPDEAKVFGYSAIFGLSPILFLIAYYENQSRIRIRDEGLDGW